MDDDTIPRNGYEHMLATARPLPGGEYVVLYNLQLYVYFPCNFVPDDTYTKWTVTVSAPAGTQHEAYFDPAADGVTTGFTASSGRLEPAEFTVSGTTVEITDLHWTEGSVSLALNPPGALRDFSPDFIGLDGSLFRSLPGPAATEDTNTGTITWAVTIQPWQDGDLLLLRIRDGSGSPVSLPAPTPAHTPEPTTTATWPLPGGENPLGAHQTVKDTWAHATNPSHWYAFSVMTQAAQRLSS